MTMEINSNSNNKKIELSDHSVFFKRRQQQSIHNQQNEPLDFDMEWDNDHKLYVPPKLAPSSFKLNIENSNNNKNNNNDNNNKDTSELMSVDEITNDIKPQKTQPVNKTKEEEDSTSQIDLNKVSIISGGNEDHHYKVKKSSPTASLIGHHPTHQQAITTITTKKPFFQRYSKSTMLSPSILYGNHNNHHHHLQYQQHQQQLQQHQQNHLQHPTTTSKVPEILEGYLHFIVRLILVCLLFFGIYIIFNSILHDVNFKYKQYSAELSKQVEKCTKLYSDNRCLPITRIPAMEQTCTEWELCMAKDPTTLPKSKILAEILSEVLDSFVSTMSYKTILFLICIIWMMIWIPNKLFLSNSNNNGNGNKNRNTNNNNQARNNSSPQHIQPTQSIFAKNLFTIEQNHELSKSLEKRLLSDKDDYQQQ